MSSPPPTAPTPAGSPSARPDEPSPLRLLRESHGPRVELVAFGGRGPATDAQREELARVAISRASGTHVVVAALSGAEIGADGAGGAGARRLPPDVERLASGGALELAFRGAAWRVFAPRGRGRVLHPAGLDLEIARAGARALADATTRAGFERTVDALVADGFRGGGSSSSLRGEGEAAALDDAALDVADPRAAAASSHSIDRGGELCLESPHAGCVLAARLVRGRERFLLELRRGGEPLARESLVLLRYTAPADRGALLRVELDDEDLGPWRLGEHGDGGCWSLDLFRIPGDLLAGRERAALAFAVADGREVASMRWRFLVEPEFEGIWLTDLDATVETIRSKMAPRRDRDDHGRLLQLAGRDRTRGFRLEPGARVSYAIPAGYRSLSFTASAALAIAIDGEPLPPIEWRDGSPPREGAAPIPGACTLTVAVPDAAGAPVLVVDPKLLR